MADAGGAEKRQRTSCDHTWVGHAGYMAVECGVCQWKSLRCDACGSFLKPHKKHTVHSSSVRLFVPWHEQAFKRHARRCVCGTPSRALHDWDDAHASGDTAADSSAAAGGAPTNPTSPCVGAVPLGLKIRCFASRTDEVAALAACALPECTIVNPLDFGAPHWPPRPEFWGKEQPRNIVAAAACAGAGGESVAGLLADGDAQLAMDMRALVMGTTPAQHELLARVLAGVDHNARTTGTGASAPQHGDGAPRTQRPFSPPLTVADFKRVLHGGKRSISARLPQPHIYDLGEGHAVADLGDVLALLLASGAPVSFVSEWHGPVEHSWQGAHAQRVRRHAISVHGEHLIVPGSEWSDDFENNYINDNCDSSAHVIAMAFGKLDGRDTDENVFIVGMSKKGADHEIAFEHLRQQLETLATPQPFYHGALCATVLIAFHLVLKIADDPEVRYKCAFKGGGRQGWMGGDAVLAAHLPPCGACAPRVLRGEPPQQCTDCAAWDYAATCLRFGVPLHWPGTEKELPPACLSLGELNTLADCVYDNLAAKVWTEKEAGSVLDVARVPKRARDRIFESYAGGGRWRPANWLGAVVGGGPGCERAQHAAEPMHLWDLGVERAFLVLTYKWAAAAQKTPAVDDMWEARLDKLRPVKWLNVRSFKNTGGWKAGNYAAWTRLLRWFFTDLKVAVPSPAYTAPDRPVAEYTKPMNVAFLRACGIKRTTFDHLDAPDLHSHVAALLASDDPPVILPPGGATAQDVIVAASLLCATVSRLMQPVTGAAAAADIDRHFKAYLTAANAIDSAHRGDKKPMCLSKGNHLTCLNTVQCCAQNGPPRALHGGGFMGERLVQEARKMTHSLQGNFARRALTWHYTHRVSRRLQQPLAPPNLLRDVKVLRHGASALAGGSPVQLVRSPLSEQFGIVVQASATELVAEAVEHVGAPHDAGMGVAFWQWHKSGCTFRLAPGDAEHWVLLPPHAGAAHEGWYAVGNTWCEVGMGGRAEVPAVFAHVAGLQAATAAAASDMAVTAAAQAASAAAAVAGRAAACVAAGTGALRDLHDKGISALSGRKCAAAASLCFGVRLTGKRDEKRAALLLLLQTNQGAVADRIELCAGLKFRMEFGDDKGTVYAAKVHSVGERDTYVCLYDDGEQLSHTGDEIRTAIQSHPLHSLQLDL